MLDGVSKLSTAPLQQWISDGELFKFWGDNVDKRKGVRDVRINHHGSLLHMYTVIAGRSRIQVKELSHTHPVGVLSRLPADTFLPTSEDFLLIQKNLTVIVRRIITRYIDGMSVLSKSVPEHIEHKYSTEMAKKSETVILDVLMKNEACRTDMIDIMKSMQDYVGKDYPTDRCIPSGGDQLTCERQVGAKRYTMDGDTVRDRLGLFERDVPVSSTPVLSTLVWSTN